MHSKTSEALHIAGKFGVAAQSMNMPLWVLYINNIYILYIYIIKYIYTYHLHIYIYVNHHMYVYIYGDYNDYIYIYAYIHHELGGDEDTCITIYIKLMCNHYVL